MIYRYVQYTNLMQGKFYGYAIVIDVHSIGYSLILLICNFTMAMLSLVNQHLFNCFDK